MKSIERLSPPKKFLLVLLINFFIPGLGNVVVVGRTFGNWMLFFFAFWASTGGNHAVSFGWAVLMAIKAFADLFPPQNVTDARIRKAYPKNPEPVARNYESQDGNVYASANFSNKLRELESRDFNAELAEHKKRQIEHEDESFKADEVSDEEFAWRDRDPRESQAEQVVTDGRDDYDDYVPRPKAVSTKNEPLHVYAKDSTKPRSQTKVKASELPAYGTEPGGSESQDGRLHPPPLPHLSSVKRSSNLDQAAMNDYLADDSAIMDQTAMNGYLANDSAKLRLGSDSAQEYKPYVLVTSVPEGSANESSTQRLLGASTSTSSLSESKTSNIIGSSTTTSSLSESRTSNIIGGSTTTSSLSESKTSSIIGGSTTTSSLSESKTSNIIGGSTTTSSLSESKTSNIIGGSTTTSSLSESKTSRIIEGSTSTSSLSESKTSRIIGVSTSTSSLSGSNTSSLVGASTSNTADLSQSSTADLIGAATKTSLLSQSVTASLLSAPNSMAIPQSALLGNYSDPLQAIKNAGSGLSLVSGSVLSPQEQENAPGAGKEDDATKPFGHEFFGTVDTPKGPDTADIFASFGVPLDQTPTGVCTKCGSKTGSNRDECSSCAD